ncbi:MAG: PEGA domain-containing protein [Sandaracinaceae bacterium]
MRLLIAALSVGAVSLVGPTARAQSADPTEDAETEAAPTPEEIEARALFDRGRELADLRRFSEAADAFTRSVALVDRSSARFNLAVCFYALNRYVEAEAELTRYLAAADRASEGASYDDAERMLAHARSAIGELTIEVEPSDARVMVDGVAVATGPRRSVAVNPGPHVVRVEAEGYAPQLATVVTSAGERSAHVAHLASTRRPATLEVRAGEAPIAIDGRPVGIGDARVALDAGHHSVVVGEGGNITQRDVLLDWNQDLRLELVVPPARGAIDEAIVIASLVGAAAVVVGALIALVAVVVDRETEASTIVLLPAPSALAIEL